MSKQKNSSDVIDIRPRRVVFFDFSNIKYQKVVGLLESESIECVTVTEQEQFFKRLKNEHYDVCILNLMVGGMGPFELISNIREQSSNPNIHIIVVSKQVHQHNIQSCIRAGANDFIAEPFQHENLMHRILYHLTPMKVIDPFGFENTTTGGTEAQPYLALLLETLETLSRTTREHEHEGVLRILKSVANLIQSNRTSLIIVDAEEDTGVVLASSDDDKFFDYPISLAKYPEVLHVIHSGHFVLIEDVKQSSLTYRIGEKVKSINIGSLMVFPIRHGGSVIGALTIRRPKASNLPSMQVMRILQAMANTLAVHSHSKAVLRRIYKSYKTAVGE